MEMSAGALQQKWEIAGASGYLGQGSTDILAGLGPERGADVVRLLWPTGVLQDEIEIPAHKTDTITEIDRRGSSCPIVFAWNGQKFEFLADMIGPGIVGHWIGAESAEYSGPRRIFEGCGVTGPGGERAAFVFVCSSRWRSWTIWIRRGLIAVDHPSDVEVYPNARFMTNPPFPKFKVIASFEAHPPLGAWDDRGHNLLPLLVAARS